MKRMKNRMWNKKDKRVFTPKSYGIRWTLNFRNPKSYLVLATIVIILAAIFYFRL